MTAHDEGTINLDQIVAYTTGVQRSQAAYRADQAVAAGLCAACFVRKVDGQSRRCWLCAKERRGAS